MRRTPSKLVGSLSYAFLLSLLVSAQSTPMPSSPPAASTSSWTTLDEMLSQLGLEATALNEDSKRLAEQLLTAQRLSETLSSQLTQSLTGARELSRSLLLSERSLATSSESLKLALSSRDLELWIWRGATAAGIIVAVLALIGR